MMGRGGGRERKGDKKDKGEENREERVVNVIRAYVC